MGIMDFASAPQLVQDSNETSLWCSSQQIVQYHVIIVFLLFAKEG